MNLHTGSVSVYPSLAHPDVHLALASSKKLWKFLCRLHSRGYSSLGSHSMRKG